MFRQLFGKRQPKTTKFWTESYDQYLKFLKTTTDNGTFLCATTEESNGLNKFQYYVIYYKA